GHHCVDAFGRVVRAVDANGNVRLQSWDRLGRSVTAIDPGGALRTTAYDAYGRVLTQTDPAGAVTTYAYDTAARRLTVISPEGVVTTSTTSRHGQVVSVTDGTGQVTTTTYDRDGHLVRTQGPAGVTTATYDAAGRLQETTDGVGNKVAYGYDAASRVTSRTVDPGGLNLVTTWQIDSRGRRVSTTDPNGVVTTSEFDRKGQLVRQTIDPAGLNLQTRYTWDGAGRQLTVTSPGGTAVQTQYDNLGRRTRQVIDPAGLALTSTWAYDRDGNVVVAADPRGNVTRYAYDSSDRLLCTADPSGGVQQLVYDVAGRVVRTTSYATPIPLAGLAIPATAAAILARVVAQPLADVVEHRVYDRDSRVVATVDGTGAVVAFAYDGGGNVVRRTAYANRIALAGWAPGTLPAAAADPQHDLMTSTLYDAAGRAIYSVDAVGALVACSYDANGNLLQRRAYAAPVPAGTAATASALGAAAETLANASVDSWTRNVWDAAGRLTWSVEGTGAVTQRVYDKAGNIVRQVAYANALTPGAALSLVSASSATDRVLSMAYDTANRLVFQVDPLRAVVESAYDANGNVVRRTAYATAISSVPTLGLPGTAAAIRALLLPGSSDRTERYGYDKAGRQVIAVDAVGAVTQQTYDAAGAVVQVTARANLVNASGVPASPTLASLQALVTANASADRVARRAYDAAGRLVYDVDGMGAVSARSYDGVGRLLRITRHALTIGSAPTTTAAIAAALQVHAGDRTESSTYDAAGHRVSVTDAMGATESTTFDALGNRTTFTNKLGATWTYDNDAAGHQCARCIGGHRGDVDQRRGFRDHTAGRVVVVG
ncbi:MAG: RHS repeat protein, partial [Comamonadaceae bacterium]